MPAFVCLMYLLLWLLPLWLEKFGVQRQPFRWLTFMVFVFGCLQLLAQSELSYLNKTFALGNGADEVKTFNGNVKPDGIGIRESLSWLREHSPTNATLAVMPEGALVKYLERRVNPTGYPVWIPPELHVFGQSNMTAAFVQHSPDCVMFIHNESAVKAYKLMYFGQREDYGLPVMRWIRENYDLVYQIGAVPLQTTNFGVQILKRRVSTRAPQIPVEK